MFEEALSMAQRSSGVRSTFAAPRFSSRQCSLFVPCKVQYIQSTGICDNGLVFNSPSQCPLAACSSAFLGKGDQQRDLSQDPPGQSALPRLVPCFYSPLFWEDRLMRTWLDASDGCGIQWLWIFSTFTASARYHPSGTRWHFSKANPALPCRAFTWRRFATGV